MDFKDSKLSLTVLGVFENFAIKSTVEGYCLKNKNKNLSFEIKEGKERKNTEKGKKIIFKGKPVRKKFQSLKGLFTQF